MRIGPYELSASELAAVLAAERAGRPFLAFRDAGAALRLVELQGRERITVGRLAEAEVALEWDVEVSRVHAQLEPVGGTWVLVDDGLSRNGSFVNGERMSNRWRLENGDVLTFGRTAVVFRAARTASPETAPAGSAGTLAGLTPGQRRVLVALCRPLLDPSPAAVPASNREIADELSLSISGVKSHIRALFERLGVGELPQNRKRAELARRAIAGGLVTARDLRG
jgi:hypothetical protein